MASRLPKPRKPSEQLRRRNTPESWTVLPHEVCGEAVPKWPGAVSTPDTPTNTHPRERLELLVRRARALRRVRGVSSSQTLGQEHAY